MIISNIQKHLRKSFDWLTDSVVYHFINISKYNPLAGSSYVKLPKEFNHLRKGLINIQNFNDNECSNWCLLKYLNPTDHQPTKIIWK